VDVGTSDVNPEFDPSISIEDIDQNEAEESGSDSESSYNDATDYKSDDEGLPDSHQISTSGRVMRASALKRKASELEPGVICGDCELSVASEQKLLVCLACHDTVCTCQLALSRFSY
jgi:hypothetical protein